jgi:PAS domain S-box-containing protein
LARNLTQTLKLEALVQPRILQSLMAVDQAVWDALPLGVYACDADGHILRVNRTAVELWGQAPRMLDPTQRFCGSYRAEGLDGTLILPNQTPMARAVQHGESFKGVEARVQNPDGKRWLARIDIEPLRDADGAVIGAVNCFQDVTHEHDARAREHQMRQALERQQRTFDLAMIASKMGTWRYTVADNICVYDENAQGLYGLTDGRFLHDEAGVKDKIHADDIDLMWAQVAKAVDPEGDGRYEAEYRVKQRDGSWRWVSAWGLVEFEGQGPARKVAAIAGASRDLTERKQAEELQRLLLNELNHRVKNTLATVQSIAYQTLKGATDIDAARTALDARILSLAPIHDLLTESNWVSADLRDVVERGMQPFAASRIQVSGPSVHLSPKHALALSLALHELATNAAKYGALSTPGGRVDMQWHQRGNVVGLNWRESGGPAVTAPTHRGFGSRLLEVGLVRSLGGKTKLDYASSGVCCEISISL